MEANTEILALLKERQVLEYKLGNLIYGSPEIRERQSNSYLYVHYREDAFSRTKYVGEYSDDLYNLVLNNTLAAKDLKKQIKKITKKLKELKFSDSELDEKVLLNIDFARRNLVDIIYKQAILEGIATTFADTENILEGGKVNDMTSEDVRKIVNLKHAWEFVLNKNVISTPTNFMILSEINKFILEGFYYSAGQVRSVPVTIGGTAWQPPLPIESIIKEGLAEILESDIDVVDQAIELLLFVMKRQIFIDGNKRTAVVFANHFLVAHGKGTIAVPTDLIDDYKTLLLSYYEGDEMSEIKTFLLEKCYKKI